MLRTTAFFVSSCMLYLIVPVDLCTVPFRPTAGHGMQHVRYGPTRAQCGSHHNGLTEDVSLVTAALLSHSVHKPETTLYILHYAITLLPSQSCRLHDLLPFLCHCVKCHQLIHPKRNSIAFTPSLMRYNGNMCKLSPDLHHRLVRQPRCVLQANQSDVQLVVHKHRIPSSVLQISLTDWG